MSIDKFNVRSVESTVSVSEVNDLLKKGWVLLETAPGQDESGSAYVLFVLGLVESDKPF